MSIHFLSRRGIEMGDSGTAGFGRGFCFCDKFPCNSVLDIFKRNGFCRFGDKISSFRSQFELKKLFRLKTEIRSRFHFRNVLDVRRPSHPRPDRSSCFQESTLSLGMLLQFDAICTLDIDSSFHLVLLLLQV